jgi:hypothetical protein
MIVFMAAKIAIVYSEVKATIISRVARVTILDLAAATALFLATVLLSKIFYAAFMVMID